VVVINDSKLADSRQSEVERDVVAGRTGTNDRDNALSKYTNVVPGECFAREHAIFMLKVHGESSG